MAQVEPPLDVFAVGWMEEDTAVASSVVVTMGQVSTPVPPTPTAIGGAIPKAIVGGVGVGPSWALVWVGSDLHVQGGP
jgi:hypothetical protein